MKSFDAHAVILARPSAVWDVLTDTGNYPVWDSGIIDISGDLRHGGRIRVRTCSSGRKALRFRVDIMPGKSMTWSRKLPLGLGSASRTITVTDHTGFTHLRITQTTHGALARANGNDPDTGKVLLAFAEAVKVRSELLGYHLDGGLFPHPRPAEAADPGATPPTPPSLS
jgi:hypothetical protein